MARPSGQAAARSAYRAAARLEQIHREMAAILRRFPDLQASPRRSRLIVWSDRLDHRAAAGPVSRRQLH